MKPIVYLSGKYSGRVFENIESAAQVAVRLWNFGFMAFCPQTNSAHFERVATATYEDFLDGYLAAVARADAVLMLHGWEESPGATKERDLALSLGIPVYDDIALLKADYALLVVRAQQKFDRIVKGGD